MNVSVNRHQDFRIRDRQFDRVFQNDLCRADVRKTKRAVSDNQLQLHRR